LPYICLQNIHDVINPNDDSWPSQKGLFEKLPTKLSTTSKKTKFSKKFQKKKNENYQKKENYQIQQL